MTKILIDEATVKLALEALEVATTPLARDRQEVLKAQVALQEALEKQALHELAADSLNEGLRLDDWDKIVCVNHDCDKCKALAEQSAQQEPGALEQERKAFEEWIDSGFINKGHAAFHKFSDRDAYCIDEIQNKWKAWEERAKRTTPQAQPAREPLTAKEIAEFVGTHEYGPEQLKWFRLGEAAHGITKGNT